MPKNGFPKLESEPKSSRDSRSRTKFNIKSSHYFQYEKVGEKSEKVEKKLKNVFPKLESESKSQK